MHGFTSAALTEPLWTSEHEPLTEAHVLPDNLSSSTGRGCALDLDLVLDLLCAVDVLEPGEETTLTP